MKRIIICALTLLFALFSFVLFFISLESAAPRVSFGRDYTIVRVFRDGGFSPSYISNIRYALDEGSVGDTDDGKRLWCDASSYFTSTSVSGEDGRSVQCNAIVTEGDFFLFHELEFLDGWCYSEDDLNLDRVVIDRRLAFSLFGSASCEGMKLNIGGETCFVAGVVEYEDSEAKKMALGDMPLIYIPSNIAELAIPSDRNYDYYEVMMQNSTSGYARSVVEKACEGAIVVDATERFSILGILSVIKAFPTRSYMTSGVVLPYWENEDRGVEDTLACLFVFSLVLTLVFISNL
ncbi:MAG: ABC transporter permease, partial [Clostridia bacterium]|nr:ABC transporter permease [Clostridia bacterium]